ncbi:hypothetical protein Taro_029230 [Colocasia esculenta]|uniref:Aminotransferase-like plant mobile domain-containing protein n=1 Tax=Colocasia esculenta TaxID=4460 RepID=A0A843VDB5_COLES|nr:hypothetical protein [Colocasia esculenta]
MAVGGRAPVSDHRVGLFLSGADEPSDRSSYGGRCFLQDILQSQRPSWYGKFSVRRAHVPRPGATEWLQYVLQHDRHMLDLVGIRHSVTAALYRYPCYMGLIQAIAERYNSKWNTICTAEGETAIDLWAFHRISGLPITGEPYEEVILDEFYRNSTDGQGRYEIEFCYRYLMKTWCDLAEARQSTSVVGGTDAPGTSRNTPKVSLHTWVRYFYGGPFCYNNEFARAGSSRHDMYEIPRHELPDCPYIYESPTESENPWALDEITHLAAYLSYWLCTFAMPFGEESLLRPEVIYPACRLACGCRLALAPAALACIYHSFGTLSAHDQPRDSTTLMATHYISVWAHCLLPSRLPMGEVRDFSIPLIFRFMDEPEGDDEALLSSAGDTLGFVPVGAAGKLNFDHSSLDFRSFPSHSEFGQPGWFDPWTQQVVHGFAEMCVRLAWLQCTRPGVLVFRRGQAVVLEPYYPHRFARNFGYDKRISSDFEFPQLPRILHGRCIHLQARMWWNLFQQDNVSLLVHTSPPTYRGAVTLKYADWWASHSGNFTQRSGAIRHVEKDYLRRQDRPHFHIRDKYLKKYFPELAIHVINAFQARDKSRKHPLAQVEVEHADNHPVRKKSASKKRARAAALDPPPSYQWWSDFVHACGLPPDAPADSLLPPDTFSDDSAKEWIVYLRSVLTSLGPRREAFLVQRARSLDDVWSAVSSGARELGLFPQTVIPRSLESVLPSNTVSPSCRVAQPETRVRPTVCLSVPSSEVGRPFHLIFLYMWSQLVQCMQVMIVIISCGFPSLANTSLMHLLVPSLIPTTSTEPLLSSLLSKDQNVEPMPLVSEAQGGHSREDDVDDWDYELDVTDIPILNLNWDPSMENPEDPNFSILFDDLMTMMEEPLPTPDQGVLQDITAVVEPTATEAPPFPSTEGTSDQGNPLSPSTPIALNVEKSETPAPSHPPLDFSAPHEETGIPVEPLPQPSDPGINYAFPFVKYDFCDLQSCFQFCFPGLFGVSTFPLLLLIYFFSSCFTAAIGQDELSPAPDPGKTNNNGDDSFVPLHPASDLPFVVEKVEVAIKSFEHLSDVENSDATSPLDASGPDSSETYVISGDHSESTEPLSGETQQLSITFEAACDDAEVSSRPSLAASGLDRSPQALEVLEGRLAALRGEAIGTAGQISMVRDQHASLLSRQREESARATLLRMLASCLDRLVTEDVRHSIALTVRLLSLEVEQNRIHAAIAVLEAEVDSLRAGFRIEEFTIFA